MISTCVPPNPRVSDIMSHSGPIPHWFKGENPHMAEPFQFHWKSQSQHTWPKQMLRACWELVMPENWCTRWSCPKERCLNVLMFLSSYWKPIPVKPELAMAQKIDPFESFDLRNWSCLVLDDPMSRHHQLWAPAMSSAGHHLYPSISSPFNGF